MCLKIRKKMSIKTKVMKKLFSLVFIFLATCSSAQVIVPDLSNAEDLKKLGIGKIIEKDNSILKNITLLEVKENGIVYLKDGSMHDMTIESIKRIEFPESRWNSIIIEFKENKPEFSWKTAY
jgi:hypothetical protein